MHKTLAILILSLFCAHISMAQTVIRQYDFITDGGSFPQSQDVTWMQGESVRWNVTVRRGNYAVPITSTSYPTIRAWASNNVGVLYASQTGSIVDAASGRIRVDLNAGEAAFSPSGTYNYAIAVYDGTNFMGVAASGKATVRGYPFTGSGYVGVQYPFPGITGAVFLGSAGGGVTGQTITINTSGNAITGNQHNAILGGLTISNALQFGATPSVTTNARSMYWDVDEHTVSVPMESGGVVGQMFKEGYIYGQNKSGRTVTNGTAVKIVADPGGTGIRFDLASSTNAIGRGHFIGLVTQSTITNNGFGYVTTWGEVHDVNTAAWTNGDDLYLDGDGVITNIAPTPPAYPVHVGYVVRSHATLGTVYVRGGNVELDPVWSLVSNHVAQALASNQTAIAGKLATNGIQAGGLGGVVITNANGFAYISATNAGGGGSGTLTNIASTSATLTVTSGGGPSVTLGLPTAVSETNITARLASNTWAEADSTTNYARMTGGNVLYGSNVISGLSISTNTSGVLKLNTIDGNGQDTISIYAGGFRSSAPAQDGVGAVLTLRGTNTVGGFTLSSPNRSGSISAGSNLFINAGVGQIVFFTTQGVSMGSAILTNGSHIMTTGLLQTAGSAGLYAPLYVSAAPTVVSNLNPGSGPINMRENYFDDRSTAEPRERDYINVTTMQGRVYFAGEYWAYSEADTNAFPAGFGVGIRLGPHSATSAVYFASIETRASGTNDRDGRITFALNSSELGSDSARREVAYFDSARNMVVSGNVTSARFIGDGSGLTNLSGGSVTLTSNVVWKVPSMRGAWDISTDVPAGGGVSLGFDAPFTTSTTYRASIRTLSTAATYRVAQGAVMCLSSVATNRGTVFIDYVAWTNTATNSVWFTPFDGTNRLATVNLTTTAVYQVDGSGWGARAVIPFFAGNQAGSGVASTNPARSFLPPIGEVER